MTKTELIKQVAKDTGVTRADTKLMVGAIFDAIADALDSGQEVLVNGFGTFRVGVTAAHEGFLPSGERTQIPERRRVNFKSSKELKGLLNGGSSDASA